MSPEQLSNQAKALRNISLFSELPEQVVEELASELQEVEAQKDHVIIKKGEQGDSMFLVSRGAVMVHDGDQILATLIVGEYFGEYALIDSYTRSASVTATQSTILFQLSREKFDSIMEQHPKLKDAVLKELIKRLRNLNVIQEQLLKSNHEIQEQKREIQQMNAYLSDVSEEKDKIMRILAHELKNTLTSTISISESLQQELSERTPDLLEYIERMTSSLWRMNDRIDRILSVKSKLPQEKELRISTINLSEVMDELSRQFEEAAATKGVKLQFKVEPYLVQLDRVYTHEILENLIGNAIKFSTSGTRVLVKSKEKENELNIMISDQGPGLTEQAKRPITNPEILEEIHIKNASDLSLTIVRKFTEAMGGSISCESEPGKGACFTLRFKEYKRPATDGKFWGMFKS
jgi:signal transduction histidine kinase